MATTSDIDDKAANDLYLTRLDALERQIRRQRHVLVDHDLKRRNSRTWDAIQHKHHLRSARFADHRHMLQELIEDLRFDVDVLVEDLRRFFASGEVERTPRGMQRAKDIQAANKKSPAKGTGF